MLALKVNQPEKLEQDEISSCSTRPPSPSAELSPFHLPARKEGEVYRPSSPTAFEPVRGQRDRYVLLPEVLGGGMTGVVQKGFDAAAGRVVAVKRIRCDKNCYIRFLEIYRENGEILSAEGYAPVDSEATCWGGPLAHDLANAYGAEAFAPASVEGCVVVVRRGGGVPFLQKLRNAQRGGASGVLIVNGADAAEVYSLGEAEAPLPSVMVTSLDGEAAIEAALASQACGGGGSSPSRPAVAEVSTDVRHELAICRRLRPHPQVAQVLDCWEDGASAVLILEFCRGGKAAAPPRGPQGLPTALWLIKQMLEGVAHLHSHGICHRDLKPENMLLTRPLEEPGARLVLVDFSMASTAERMRVPCGSPRYTAPEVLQGEGYGLKRDIWSAGMVAHELIFRTHPFRKLSDQEVVGMLLEGKAPRVEASPEVPQAVGALLGSLLEVDPHCRPSAELALRHPCFHLVGPPSVGQN